MAEMFYQTSEPNSLLFFITFFDCIDVKKSTSKKKQNAFNKQSRRAFYFEKLKNTGRIILLFFLISTLVLNFIMLRAACCLLTCGFARRGYKRHLLPVHRIRLIEQRNRWCIFIFIVLQKSYTRLMAWQTGEDDSPRFQVVVFFLLRKLAFCKVPWLLECSVCVAA